MLGDRRHRLAFRLRHPRTTIRWRLTLLYGALFLASGAALLAITYTLVDHATLGAGRFGRIVSQSTSATPPGKGPGGSSPSSVFRRIGPQQVDVPARLRNFLRTKNGKAAVEFVGSGQRIADLHQLEVESVIALAIMAVISAALGWLVAGRVLRPLRTMTATTQQISEASLDQRLAMRGPRDELRQLADTIDGLLGRLQGAFDAQRGFVANASHELRTPLTVTRAMLEMVISDPSATVETFRTTCEQVLEESEQQERLIDALLALARGQRGIDHTESLDLAVIVGTVVQAHEPDAAARDLHLEVSLDSAPVSGDRRLIERLVSNVLENALTHNVSSGHVHVRVTDQSGRATLTIANTGPRVPADQIDRLLQPFQRLAPDRVGHGDGLGLGLSIVAAIANAHDAALDVHPGTVGGLQVEVRFPHAADGNAQITANGDDTGTMEPLVGREVT
jgi:signal transduction histidine kinase